MKHAKDSTSESRRQLLERIRRQKQKIAELIAERENLLERLRRQKQTIKELIAERNDLKRRLAAMGIHQTDAAMLREQLRNWRKSIADIIDIIRRFREAIRDERTGDFIGGANRRRILADVDDAAVIAISAIAGRGGRDTEKEKQ